MIPIKIQNLIYTKHARLEQFRDEKGLILFTPKSFYKAGCKSCIEQNDGILRVVYIYDDKRDLYLIIDPITQEVITNYIKFSDNRGIYRGRFRITR